MRKQSYTFSELSQIPDINSNCVKLAVLGNPIDHSLSPLFQEASLRFFGIEGFYVRLEIYPKEILETLQFLKERKFTGCNITLPLKEKVFALCDSADKKAKAARSVNTIRFSEKIEGFNTDGIGFQNALEEILESSLGKYTPLLLGAGGASRSLLPQMIISGCKKIFLTNRDKEKAKKLQKIGESLNPGADIIILNSSEISQKVKEVNLIINATSLGLNIKDAFPIDPALLSTEKHFFYDIIPQETPLLKICKQRNIPCSNGLEMLLEQGRESFILWFGQTPPRKILRKSVQFL